MANKRLLRIGGIWPVILVFACAVLCAGSPALAKMMKIDGKTYDIAQPGEFKPGEVVVKVKPGVTVASIVDLAPHIGAKWKKSVPEYDLHLLTFPAAASKEAQKAKIHGVIRGLRAFPQVENAFPNHKFSIPKPVGPVASQKGAAPPSQPAKEAVATPLLAAPLLADFQWHLYRIKYPFSVAPPTTGPTVAVIDTGVDATHPDLAGNVLTGYDFILDMPGGTIDGVGHGTHVSGIIAANSGTASGVMGVSPTSKILPVRVLDNTGSGTWFDVMQGIIWARNQSGVKVLNMSLGGYIQESTDPTSDYMVFKTVIDDTFAAGKVVCVAAGNEDNINLYSYAYYAYNYRPVPAYYPNSFTVAASQEVDCRAYFSNYNARYLAYNYDFNYVDIVAPGWMVLSTVPGGQYAQWSGTSMATPVVAGCAARVFARYPAYTNSLVQTRLTSTAKSILAGNGFPAYPGYQKRVDLGKALGGTACGLVGVVYDGPVGRPLAGVTVQATATGGVTGNATTNGAGFFTLTGLTAALPYTLNFTKTGYSPFNYYTAYGPLNTTAAKLNDVPMPVFLNGVRPNGQWSVLVTYHSWHPGYYEAIYSYPPPKPDWLPINWNQTDGTYFSTEVYQNGSRILKDPGYRGELLAAPYAAITSSPWDFMNPGVNVVIKPQGSSVYQLRTLLDNNNDIYYEWGKYKGTGVNATAFIYYGSTLKATVQARLATAIGTTNVYWRIADLKPSGVCTVINQLATSP